MIPLEKIILLNQLPLFSSLPTDQIRAIAHITTEDYRKAGELFYAKGDDAGRLCILVSGQVELEDKHFQTQDIIGVTSLFSDATQTSDAVCIEDTEFLLIEREDIEALIHEEPAIAISLLKVFTKQF
jgi:signal-transduction protein with cAMP-binding, CBS, and nucleotidyltransferase domain